MLDNQHYDYIHYKEHQSGAVIVEQHFRNMCYICFSNTNLRIHSLRKKCLRWQWGKTQMQVCPLHKVA